MTNKIFLLLSFMLLGVAINAKELQATSPAASFESSIQIKLIIDNYDVDLPLADLIYNDIAGILQESIISAEHMGERTIDGMPCHHLSYESTGADWQVWVQKWEKPVPRRFAINYVNIDGSPQFLAMLKEWQINPSLDEKIFTFNPPFGAKEAELMKAVGSKKVN